MGALSVTRYSRSTPTKSPLSRFSDWDIKLAEYIKSVRDKPFTWGEHDCLTFANNAVAIQRGTGFAGNSLGNYKTARGAIGAYNRWIESSGFADVFEGLDEQFERITTFPPRGSIVAMPMLDGEVFPYTFGVMVSQYAAFVGEHGLLMVRPDKTFLAWRIE